MTLDTDEERTERQIRNAQRLNRQAIKLARLEFARKRAVAFTGRNRCPRCGVPLSVKGRTK